MSVGFRFPLPNVEAYSDWKPFAKALLRCLEAQVAEQGGLDQSFTYRVTHIEPGSLPEWPAGYTPVWMDTATAELYLGNPEYDPPTAPDIVFIDTQALADASVELNKLADNSVATQKLLDGAVVTLKLGAAAVEEAKLATAAVTQLKIASNAVVNAALADLAVGTAELQALAITEGKVGAQAITQAKIGLLAVGSAQIANAAVGTLQVANAAIVNAHLGTASVQSANIQDAAVIEAKIGTASIITAKLASAAVTSAKIGDAQILTALIADLQVVNAKIGDLAVNEAKIANLAVTSAKIANLAVGNAHILEVSAAKLIAGTIIAADIYVGDVRTALHGSYSGAGKGAYVVTYAGGGPAAVLGWVDAGTVGFRLYNTSGKLLLDHTADLSIWEVAAELDAFAEDGIIARSEKKSVIPLINELMGRYYVLEARKQELGLISNARNLIAHSELNTSWSPATPTVNGTTPGPKGNSISYINLANAQVNLVSLDALTAGANYVQHFFIKHNQPGKKYHIGVRKVGGAAVNDLTNYSIIEVTDDWRFVALPHAALASTSNGILFEGRDTQLAALGYATLPAGFAIAADMVQVEVGLAPSPGVRTTGAAVTQNYLTTALANFRAALGMIYPAIDDMSVDSFLFPADNELADAILSSGWANTSASRIDLGNGNYRIADTSASVMGFRETSVVTSVGPLTLLAVVAKDATGRATRFPRFAMRSGSDHIHIDTSTGASNGDGSDLEVFDGGTHWIVRRTQPQTAGTNTIRVYPSRGAGAAWTDDVAPMGSVDIRSLTVFFGSLTPARRRGSFRTALEQFARALDRLRKSISGTDGTTALRPVGATVINIPATYLGDASASLPHNEPYVAKLGVGTVVGNTWTVTVLEGGSGITSSIGATSGTLSITALTVKKALLRVESTYNGVASPIDVTVNRIDAAAPPSTGGGSGDVSSTNLFLSINSTSWTTIATLTRTVTSAAPALNASLAIYPLVTGSTGNWNVEMKWVREAGASDVDIGAVANSDPDPTVSLDDEGSGNKRTIGNITCNRADSGRTAGVQYTYYLMARLTSGTKQQAFDGVATVTG